MTTPPPLPVLKEKLQSAIAALEAQGDPVTICRVSEAMGYHSTWLSGSSPVEFREVARGAISAAQGRAQSVKSVDPMARCSACFKLHKASDLFTHLRLKNGAIRFCPTCRNATRKED